MKILRQSKIIELINHNRIETQETLAELLRANGFLITQATVSRDIRELKLTKVLSEDGRQYYAVANSVDNQMAEKFVRLFRDGVKKIDFANNIVVIKTHEGMAMAVAATIDAMNYTEIIGSIAGDNTLFCLTKTQERAVELIEKFNRLQGDGGL